MSPELVKLILEASVGIVSILGILWVVVKVSEQRTSMLLNILADHAKERETWFTKGNDL